MDNEPLQNAWAGARAKPMEWLWLSPVLPSRVIQELPLCYPEPPRLTRCSFFIRELAASCSLSWETRIRKETDKCGASSAKCQLLPSAELSVCFSGVSGKMAMTFDGGVELLSSGPWVSPPACQSVPGRPALTLRGERAVRGPPEPLCFHDQVPTALWAHRGAAPRVTDPPCSLPPPGWDPRAPPLLLPSPPRPFP